MSEEHCYHLLHCAKRDHVDDLVHCLDDTYLHLGSPMQYTASWLVDRVRARMVKAKGDAPDEGS